MNEINPQVWGKSKNYIFKQSLSCNERLEIEFLNKPSVVGLEQTSHFYIHPQLWGTYEKHSIGELKVELADHFEILFEK